MATQLVPTIGTIHDITELANGSLHWTIETRGWIVCCAAIKLILVFACAKVEVLDSHMQSHIITTYIATIILRILTNNDLARSCMHKDLESIIE